MSNEKLRELEISRGIAIVGVLLIHVTSLALMETPIQSWAYSVYLALNRLGHFSVPTFIFLSGLVLFYRYFEHWHVNQSMTFYWKRLKYILIPYLIWSTFYFRINHAYQQSEVMTFRAYLLDLITGSAEYHLYFVILLIQYYLLLPVLFTLLKKVNIHGGILILSALAIQILTGILNYKYHWIDDKSIMFSTYFTAFIIGCLVGRSYRSARQWIQKYYPWLLTSTLIFMVLHLSFAELEIRGFHIEAVFQEFIVHLFSVFAALTILYLASSLPWSNYLGIWSVFGRCSLGVYIIHPVILRVAERYLHFPVTSLMYHPSIFLRMIIVLTIPVIVVLGIKRYRWAWVILGR